MDVQVVGAFLLVGVRAGHEEPAVRILTDCTCRCRTVSPLDVGRVIPELPEDVGVLEPGDQGREGDARNRIEIEPGGGQGGVGHVRTGQIEPVQNDAQRVVRLVGDGEIGQAVVVEIPGRDACDLYRAAFVAPGFAERAVAVVVENGEALEFVGDIRADATGGGHVRTAVAVEVRHGQCAVLLTGGIVHGHLERAVTDAQQDAEAARVELGGAVCVGAEDIELPVGVDIGHDDGRRSEGRDVLRRRLERAVAVAEDHTEPARLAVGEHRARVSPGGGHVQVPVGVEVSHGHGKRPDLGHVAEEHRRTKGPVAVAEQHAAAGPGGHHEVDLSVVVHVADRYVLGVGRDEGVARAIQELVAVRQAERAVPDAQQDADALLGRVGRDQVEDVIAVDVGQGQRHGGLADQVLHRHIERPVAVAQMGRDIAERLTGAA